MLMQLVFGIFHMPQLDYRAIENIQILRCTYMMIFFLGDIKSTQSKNYGIGHKKLQQIIEKVR